MFQTEIRNCVPIASDLIFNVRFDSVSGSTPVKVDQRPIAVVTGQGVATRPPGRCKRRSATARQTIRVAENLLGPATPPPTFNPLFSQNGPPLQYGNLRPAPVEVRATVTVTYVMKT